MITEAPPSMNIPMMSSKTVTIKRNMYLLSVMDRTQTAAGARLLAQFSGFLADRRFLARGGFSHRLCADGRLLLFLCWLLFGRRVLRCGTALRVMKASGFLRLLVSA